MMSHDMKFILKRYPSFKENITRFYAESEEFKGLCEDIYSMAQTLEKHDEKLFTDLSHELEYRKLLLELENELLKYLGDTRGVHSAKKAK
jgi:hypothetical protein